MCLLQLQRLAPQPRILLEEKRGTGEVSTDIVITAGIMTTGIISHLINKQPRARERGRSAAAAAAAANREPGSGGAWRATNGLLRDEQQGFLRESTRSGRDPCI